MIPHEGSPGFVKLRLTFIKSFVKCPNFLEFPYMLVFWHRISATLNGSELFITVPRVVLSTLASFATFGFLTVFFTMLTNEIGRTVC